MWKEKMSKSLKKSLELSELTVGSWLQIGNTTIAEVMVQAGFDWLVVDMEHSAISIDQTQLLIRTIDLAGCVPLVRLSNNDPTLIKRVMDAGSHGIIVPNVNSADDAIAAVNAVRYPPAGTRGVGLWRAQGYGFDFEKYKKWQEENSIVIAQIEHIKGIENLEQILNVNGIDATIIGPYDLSGSLGCPGEFEHPEVKNALLRYNSICKKLNKPMGIHVITPKPQDLQQAIEKGYSFVAWSLDAFFLGFSCREGLKKIGHRTKNST
jgi:2-keto-3-deoxy-L-rhamnonate aldolase RhmA